MMESNSPTPVTVFNKLLEPLEGFIRVRLKVRGFAKIQLFLLQLIMTSSKEQKIVDRLNQHPKLRDRVESLLDVIENTAGDCTKADDAERYVIEALRKMGNDALHCWGDTAVDNSIKKLQEEHSHGLQRHEKKVHWHSTFGKIEVIEPVFHYLGKQIRPFLNSSELTTRGCSMPLQRVITDFGADHAFGQVSTKLEEH